MKSNRLKFTKFKLSQPLSFLMLLSTLLVIPACSTTVNTNATPIVMFPSAVPKENLPTFASVSQVAPTVAPATAIPMVATNIATTASTLRPTATKPPTPIPPTKIPTLDANWSTIANGVVYRRLSFNNSLGQGVGVLVTRIDPAQVNIQVKYTTGQVKSINDWMLALPGAKVIVNANYYDQNKNPIGLVSVNGNIIGRATGRNDAGFFQVNGNTPKVRSLFLQPYNNTERFDQVVEGFPMLVVRGRAAPAFNPDLRNVPDRRTVIAQDVYGRILIIVTSPGSASFSDMANWLVISGLEVDSALNLDGGSSTSMYLATGGPSQITPGLQPYPVAVAVFSR